MQLRMSPHLNEEVPFSRACELLAPSFRSSGRAPSIGFFLLPTTPFLSPFEVSFDLLQQDTRFVLPILVAQWPTARPLLFSLALLFRNLDVAFPVYDTHFNPPLII